MHEVGHVEYARLLCRDALESPGNPKSHISVNISGIIPRTLTPRSLANASRFCCTSLSCASSTLNSLSADSLRSLPHSPFSSFSSNFRGIRPEKASANTRVTLTWSPKVMRVPSGAYILAASFATRTVFQLGAYIVPELI